MVYKNGNCTSVVQKGINNKIAESRRNTFTVAILKKSRKDTFTAATLKKSRKDTFTVAI
jgi:hypothetical protein